MRIALMGCEIDNLAMEETLHRVEQFIGSGQAHQHVVVNVDKIVKASNVHGLREISNQCDLINADGMPVVWASRQLGRPIKERVAGVDLFERLIGRAAERGWRIYFLGARQEVVERVVTRATTEYPALQVAGWRDGYWKREDDGEIAKRIRECRPDILFVAMGSPRKEQFLGAYQAQMRVPFAMGVGGSFDVHGGFTRRAPMWMQQSGLEWFYRFLQEPRRMFRRYFIDDLAFIRLTYREWRRQRA